MTGKGTHISIAGQNPTIGLLVGNGQGSAHRQVLVTPLCSGPPNSSSTRKVEKILLKAVFKKGKKDPKTFTLRDIDRATVLSGCEALKSLIRKNLKDDITSGDFDVGYIQGSSVVRDLVELWSCLSEKTTTLWCDGLCTKRKHSDDEDDDYPPRKVRSKRNDTDSKPNESRIQLKNSK